jgi:hypothetical protein
MEQKKLNTWYRHVLFTQGCEYQGEWDGLSLHDVIFNHANVYLSVKMYHWITSGWECQNALERVRITIINELLSPGWDKFVLRNKLNLREAIELFASCDAEKQNEVRALINRLLPPITAENTAEWARKL